MTIDEEIIKHENALKTFKNSLAFAERTNEKHRIGKYKIKVLEEKAIIKELESKIPVESNDRLREVIEEQNRSINTLKDSIQKFKDEIKEQNKKIDSLVNPLKVKEPESIIKECPKCGKSITINNDKSMAIHQGRWCKAAH